jgi:putative methyltransferase (TIGR04325 family)
MTIDKHNKTDAELRYAEQKKVFNIWEGIYCDYASAKLDHHGGGFSGNRYIEQARNAAIESFDAINKLEQIPLFHKQRFTLFPITVSLLITEQNKKKIHVLDFGGGFGIGYLSCIESIPKAKELINYSILELPEICELGESFAKTRGIPIYFMESIPDQKQYDLVFCSSAIQYIEDWKGLIRQFAETEASKILMSDIFCGNFETFASIQNYYESKIPHWFFSELDLIEEFMKNGYELILKAAATGKRAGVDDVLPMSNFPDSHRIKTTSHLLFTKRG